MTQASTLLLEEGVESVYRQGDLGGEIGMVVCTCMRVRKMA